MAEIVDDLKFDAVLDPDKYTDYAQLGKDIVERNIRNAEKLLNNREITSNKYRSPLPDDLVVENLKQGITYEYDNLISNNIEARTADEADEKKYTLLNDELESDYFDPNFPAKEANEKKHTLLNDELEIKEDNIYNNSVNTVEHVAEDVATQNQKEYDKSTDEEKTTNKKSLAAYLEAKAETEPAASNELGVLYYLNNDIDLATKYFERAVAMDYAEAQRNLAIILEQNNSSDKQRVVSLYEAAAAQGDPAALNNLGCCYLDGDGVETDIKKAIKCFEKAVDRNDTLAMINLADCYAIGNGVRINPVKAFKLYEVAAKTENPTALARLAECYEVGAGTKQSLDKAIEYYQAAVDKGNEEVAEKLEQLLRKRVGIRYDLGTTIDEDKKQAVEASERQAAAKNKNQPSL